MAAAGILILMGLLATSWHLQFSAQFTEATWSEGIDCSTEPQDDSRPWPRRSARYDPSEAPAYEARFIISNEGESTVDLTLCAYDRSGTRLFFHEQQLQARRFPNTNLYKLDHDHADIAYALPPTDVVVIAEARGPGQSLARIAVTARVPICAGHDVIYLMMRDTALRAQGSQGQLLGSECTPAFPYEHWSGEHDRVRTMLRDGDGAIVHQSKPIADWRGAGTVIAGGAVVAATLAIPNLRIAALLLFSRLLPHRLLDQKVRSRIHDAVNQDPGVHLGELARRLELGETTVAHHARILARDGLLKIVARGTRRHLFVAARHTHLEMKVMVELRDARTRRLLVAANRTPWESLGSLAQAAGLRRPAASKILRRLRHHDIMTTSKSGRRMRIELASPAAAIVERTARTADPLAVP